MEFPQYDIVAATGVRRAVVPAGDIREDIAFQNDINLLLARLEATNPPLRALGWVREAVAAEPVALSSPEPMLRIIQGGRGTSRPVADPFVGRVAIAVNG